MAGSYGGRLASCYCLEAGVSAYHVGGAGVMVAGWPLVIVWRLVSLPIMWVGRGGYGGHLASCYCLVVGISAYHVGGAGDYGGQLASCYCL